MTDLSTITAGFILVLWVAFALNGCNRTHNPVPEPINTIDALPTAGFNFLVLGDWGRKGRYFQDEVAKHMGSAAQHLNARFVMTTGDNFYNSGVDDVYDEHWKVSYQEVYTAPSLHIPWYPALGNHDHQGNVGAQIAYSALNANWVMPDRFYHFQRHIDDTTSAAFWILDTNPLLLALAVAQKGDASFADIPQLAWLDSTLSLSQSPWKIVVGHHPIFSASPTHGSNPLLISALLPLLAKHGVQAYFAGHDHDLQHLKTDESPVHFFISGGGSKIRPSGQLAISKFSAGLAGFMAVSIRQEKMMVYIIDALGRVMHEAEVPR